MKIVVIDLTKVTLKAKEVIGHLEGLFDYRSYK